MKKIAFLGLSLWAGISFAQESATSESTIVSDSIKHWSIDGQNTLMLNQAAFSNWVGGGANNVGWIAGVNYNLTYLKDKDLWENIIILGYGENNTKGIGTRKTQDTRRY